MSFYKYVRKDSMKAMFKFLTEHFTYYTMSSWNALKSIANNVKLYNLDLGDYDVSEATEALNDETYNEINAYIESWETEHPGYKVCFNGRSGGYLVLYSDAKNNNHCLDGLCSPCRYSSYEDWKEDVIEYYDSLGAYKEDLLAQVKLVQDFDTLCDELVELLKDRIQYYQSIKEDMVEITVQKDIVVYTYANLKEASLHKKQMLEDGYTFLSGNQNGDGTYSYAYGCYLKKDHIQKIKVLDL